MRIKTTCKYCGEEVEVETDDLLHASSKVLYEHAFGECLEDPNRTALREMDNPFYVEKEKPPTQEGE